MNCLFCFLASGLHDSVNFHAAVFKSVHCCYRLAVPKSPILPLAAAVAAVALTAAPAVATSTAPGKRDEVKVVAFPLAAVKSQVPASLESHVSHSSHVSGSGSHVSHSSHSSHTSSVSHASHSSHTSSVSHASHSSHTSSVNAPAPVTTGPVTTAPVTASPSPVYSSSTIPSFGSGGSSSAIPSQSSLTVTPGDSGNSSTGTSKPGGCGFIIIAPFGAIARGIKWLASRRRTR